MSAPVVVIVAERIPAGDPTLQAMVDAAAEGLPAGTRLVVVTPLDEEREADVFAVVRWSDDAHTRATLHTRTRDGRSTDRVLAFGGADPERERGRALGYALVAMIPEELRLVETPPREAAPRARTDRADDDAGQLWLDATLQASSAFSGSATVAGGGLAARLPLRPFALRGGVAVRAGSIPEANASSLLVRADLGAAFWTVVLEPRLAVGVRSGLVLFHHALKRTRPDGGTASGTHTLLGTELVAEASWALGSRFALLGALGAEVAFGTTRVLIGTDQVTVVPPVRPLGELGVRAIF
jgi:hypothetical protein